MPSSLRADAASGVVWTAVQIWTVRIATAAAFIVLSRQLQPMEFGLVALAMAVINVLNLFGDSGISTYVQRAKSIDRVTLSTAFWTNLIISTVLAGGLALLAQPVATVFDSPDLVPVLRVLSIGLILNGLNALPSALLKRQMRFKTLAIRGTTATIAGSAVAVWMALNGYGVWALVAQSLVRSTLAVVIIWAASRWWPGFSWSSMRAKEMLSFGGQILTISLLGTIRDRGEDFVLAGTGGTTVLGLWAVANRLVRIIQEVGGAIVSSVATTAFARLQDDRPRLYRAYSASIASSGAILFPAFLLLAVISRDFVPLVLGSQWTSTGEIAQFVALATAFTVFSYFDRPVFVAVNRLRPELVLVATSVVLHLTIVVVFARFGLLVLAVALTARAAVLVPTRVIALHRFTGMPWRAWVPGLRVLAAAASMAVLAQIGLFIAADQNVWWRCAVPVGIAAVTYLPLLRLCARPTLSSIVRDVRSIRGRGRSVDLTALDSEGRRSADVST